MGDDDIRRLSDLIMESLQEFTIGDFATTAGQNKIAAAIESEIKDTLSEYNLYDVTA